jgi:Domain of unknown function (DUF4124)
MTRTLAPLLLLAILMASPLRAAPTTVYKTVDDRGTVSFSDTPPPGDAPVETLQLETPAPASDDLYRQRLEDMRATTDRLAAERREREQHRADLSRQAQVAGSPAAGAPAAGTPAAGSPAAAYLPGYYPYPVYWRGQWLPHYRPGPAPRPPLRPPALRSDLQHNRQLMRPIVQREQ